MKIVVQMLVRNEADIIAECLREITRWGLREMVILDGASDDGTVELIRGFDGADIHLVSEPDPDDAFADHLRNRLMALTLEHEPDWIVSLDADEIYHTDPVTAIEAAEAAGANVVRCAVPQFWITYDDLRRGILVEDRSRPITDRRRWYSWGHAGTFIWKANPAHTYPTDTPKRTPELPGQSWREWQRVGPLAPICKHYPFRTLEQAVRRMEARQARGGRRYFGKYYLDWIVDEAAVPLHWFNGTWCEQANHDRVYAYMGR